MHLPDPEILAEIGLSSYERRALLTLAVFGVADAASLCREGGIPTSKIYRAMEKLAEFGLVLPQATRPKMYAALPPQAVAERTAQIARERAERLVAAGPRLRDLLEALPRRLRGRQTYVDLALGSESHVKRHLLHLATARESIFSYMERGDLDAIDRAADGGFPLLRRLARNSAHRRVRHRIVFGFSYRAAPRLVEFLTKHRADLRQVTSVRYSGELGYPFHVVDGELVLLPLEHPFVSEGRFASLAVRDRDLARGLTEGFQGLWRRAMKSLGEVSPDPRGRSDVVG